MFVRARASLRHSARTIATQAATPASRNGAAGRYAFAGASAVAVVTACVLNPQPVHAEAPKALPKGKDVPEALTSLDDRMETDTLNAVVFGSNKSNLLCPDAPSVDSVRTPSATKWLRNVALRDLRLHETHAACVDARGDVYQWGDGFFGSLPGMQAEDRLPVLTLQGKDIVSLQLTASRIFALSKSGRVYTISAEAAKQTPLTPPSTSFWSSNPSPFVDHSEVIPSTPFGRGEKVLSIAAGKDHVLALTSSGRTFAHPISKDANKFGQLGFRKFDIPDPQNPTARIPVQLVPRSVTDPFTRSTPFVRPGELPAYQASTLPLREAPPAPSPDDPLTSIDDKGIHFSDRFFEINALKGVPVTQIAAGARSSFVKTSTGRVLGWGANDAGQIGLGNNVTLDTITIPTEVILSRGTPTSVQSTCIDIGAGGDLTCFAVKRVDRNDVVTVDLMLAGNGRWGGLGNNVYSSAQGSPVRAKNVSSLCEWSEKTGSLHPILPETVSISPTATGHVLLSLDTMQHAGSGARGRDLWVWGANQEYQLGTGKRSSLAAPTPLHLPIPKVLESKNVTQPLSSNEVQVLSGARFMLMNKKAKEVRDMQGAVWKRGVAVQQCAVAGFGNSVVYWKIC